MIRACAMVFLFTASSCALVHERSSPSPPVAIDAAIALDVGWRGVSDASPAPDTSTQPHVDAGPPSGCVEFWTSLPTCPAVPMSAIGQPCMHEGDTCGVHCCEPGPPIQCIGGRWMALEHMEDCTGVRCHGPTPCGVGQCAYGRVCMVPEGEVASPAQQCVLPPVSFDTCAGAPAGSLGSTGCTVCGCADTNASGVLITLDCQCC